MKPFVFLILACVGLVGIRNIAPDSERAQSLATISAASVEKGKSQPRLPAGSLPEAMRKHVVLFTGTNWCPACRQLSKQLENSWDWDQLVRTEILFTVIDVPSSGMSAAQRRAINAYGVNTFPTMVIVDNKGKLIDRTVVGGRKVLEYKAWVRGFKS
ncbi:MAG: thioredoxin family protein [Verrucomicrobiales bacterium]|nr:thioredoxin family protein [Verrucomicrobiales bacterium]